MVLKISMKPKTGQDTIQNGPINRVKRFDNISNKKVNVGTCSTRENLFNVKRRSIPSLYRTTTTSSTENRIRHPRLEPTIQLTHTSRGPNAVNNGENTERSLAKRSSSHHQSWESWQYKHPTTIRPNTNILNLGKNTSKLIIPRKRRKPSTPSNPSHQDYQQ